MYMLESLQEKFNEFINEKKWNRFMEDRCRNTYRKLMQVEKEYEKGRGTKYNLHVSLHGSSFLY